MNAGYEQIIVPYTLSRVLYQEFQEQSPLCDVTIKVGLWEKRYHWRVLVYSPFFEAIHRNSFLERQTGIIELTRWPASLVEMSLLFLYRKQPDVTESNVVKLLDIAEFLLIPGLKMICINWLKKIEVTIDNCMQLLELSSMYGFGLEDCEGFILGRLPKVLEQEGMLNVTTESIKILLSDPTLSYVPIKDWFTFIIRWVYNKESERQCNFEDLFYMLDFSGCDSEFINNIVAKEPLVKENKDMLEKTVSAATKGHNDTMLIFNNNNCKSLTCFNMTTMLWSRIFIPPISDEEELIDAFQSTPISGVKNNTGPYIYRVNKTYPYSFCILTHDLRNTKMTVSNVFASAAGDGIGICNFDNYSIANNMLVAVSIGTHTKFIRNAKKSRKKKNRANTLDDYEDISFPFFTSTLYIGRRTVPDIEMHPILTMRKRIKEICCGDNGTIAMLSSDRDSLFIFDEPSGELQRLEFETIYKLESSSPICLAAFRNGFVLHDMLKVVTISRLSREPLRPEYDWGFTWKKVGDEYAFDGERWLRFNTRSRERIEYTNHDDLSISESVLPWKSIPLPSKSEGIFSESLGVFAVSLPKSITRCHLDCPHCKLLRDREAIHTLSRALGRGPLKPACMS